MIDILTTEVSNTRRVSVMNDDDTTDLEFASVINDFVQQCSNKIFLVDRIY